jgi:hypothetical protein
LMSVLKPKIMSQSLLSALLLLCAFVLFYRNISDLPSEIRYRESD